MSTNFIGIPISGDIHYGSERKEQKPEEDLQKEIALLISYPDFEAMRWTQYTPYFNDGEPCVFHPGEVYFRFAGFPPLTEDEEDGYEEEDGFYTPSGGRYSDDDGIRRVLGVRSGYGKDATWVALPENPEMIEQARKVAGMISSGCYDDALLKAFGDHAKITLRRDVIDVETYEHD